MSSKSVGYARPEGGIGLFVVGELALGNQNKVSRPTSNEYLPPGTHSCHALGTIHPDPKDDFLVDKDVTVPNGKPVPQAGGGMCANEFVIYNKNQVKLRYIVKWKM